jgi:transcriptional regulator with XRE-family HTH domain
MASREGAAGRAGRVATTQLIRIGDELRSARVDHGLSIAFVANALATSRGHLSRIERGQAGGVAYGTLTRFAAVVGLDLVARLYPAGPPLRDVAHVNLLADLRALLHPSLRWALEVPLPIPGDRRAWDAMISGTAWRFGVEAESGPRDAQALLRRIHLKARDAGVDGVVLALRDTRVTRAFLSEALAELRSALPIDSRRALRALRMGERPPGSAVVVVPRRARLPSS